MQLVFEGTPTEIRALLTGNADEVVIARLAALASTLAAFGVNQEKLLMDTQATIDAVNAANVRLDEANANIATAVDALVKIKGETAGLVASVAALQSLVSTGNATPAALEAAVNALTAKADSLAVATSGIVVGTAEIDALVPDAPGGEIVPA